MVADRRRINKKHRPPTEEVGPVFIALSADTWPGAGCSPHLPKIIRRPVMASAGYSDTDMRNWHISLERTAPDKHQLFLERLYIPDEEIATIRSWGQTATPPPTPR